MKSRDPSDDQNWLISWDLISHAYCYAFYTCSHFYFIQMFWLSMSYHEVSDKDQKVSFEVMSLFKIHRHFRFDDWRVQGHLESFKGEIWIVRKKSFIKVFSVTVQKVWIFFLDKQCVGALVRDLKSNFWLIKKKFSKQRFLNKSYWLPSWLYRRLHFDWSKRLKTDASYGVSFRQLSARGSIETSRPDDDMSVATLRRRPGTLPYTIENCV